MRLVCNRFEDVLLEPAVRDKDGKETAPAVYGPSCRFYALETKDGRNTGSRWKVHVDGPVDFKAVSAAFEAQGVKVSEKELREAYGK